PQTTGRSDPETAVSIFVETDDEAAERAVLPLAADAIALDRAQPGRPGDTGARADPDRPVAIGEERRHEPTVQLSIRGERAVLQSGQAGRGPDPEAAIMRREQLDDAVARQARAR